MGYLVDKMRQEIKIGNKVISNSSHTYIVAEMSGNHNMDFGRAKEIIYRAHKAGADAVKIQTYTADTITLDCDNEYFQIKHGTLWDGDTLYSLYQKAYTPWEWQKELFEYAHKIGIELFSSPFDLSAVDFLENIGMPAYKVASFEINDIQLLRKIAKTGKPIIMATGIAELADIEQALKTCIEAGNDQVILLKCTSAYPTPYDEVNINMLKTLRETFGCLVGISDHTFGATVPILSVAMGGKMIEKHVTLKRSDGGTDSEFSMEMEEFEEMCKQVRMAEQAMGTSRYYLTDSQKMERHFSRSLFIADDIKTAKIITKNNVRSVRPADGMHTMYFEDIVGKKVNRKLIKGTPMMWKFIDWSEDEEKKK